MTERMPRDLLSDPERYLDAVSAAIDLPVPDEDREQVIANLRAIADVAAQLLVEPLDDDIELSPVFRA